MDLIYVAVHSCKNDFICQRLFKPNSKLVLIKHLKAISLKLSLNFVIFQTTCYKIVIDLNKKRKI